MSEYGAGTLHLSDDEFVERFETCRLSGEQFYHADHIRLAWIYLQRMPEAEAAARMAASIQRFAAHIGKSEKFHVTMTVAWMRLVAAALAPCSPCVTFSEFITAHCHLAEQKTLHQYFSPELLASDRARTGWVQPDLGPLPLRPLHVRA